MDSNKKKIRTNNNLTPINYYGNIVNVVFFFIFTLKKFLKIFSKSMPNIN